MPQEMLIIEMTCKEPVGMDENGTKKIITCIEDIGAHLQRVVQETPITHLCERYGWAAWGLLGNDVKTHVYAWPDFVTVDLSTPQPLEARIRDELMRSTSTHLKGDRVVYKTATDTSAYVDLAPDITRQRQSIHGYLTAPLSDKDFENYMIGICGELEMVQLSPPIIYENDGWMHWETSGIMLWWNKETGEIVIQIYTCKRYSEQKALEYTTRVLKLRDVKSTAI